MFMKINKNKGLNMKVITMESSAFRSLTEQIAEIAAHVRIGVWMGILLIDEYMKKHPDMTIKDLLAKTDYPATGPAPG